jgi:DNA-binding response OmpR family regulator
MKSRTRVLVVDDDRDLADSLAAVIEARGHAVSIAYSGEEAMRLAGEEQFEIVFLDVIMPGRNGVESLFALKRMQPRAAIYMMTGFSVDDLIEQALAGGALGVLRKPVAPKDVLALLPVPPQGCVLVADEDGDLAASLKPALTEAGWPVLFAASSVEAMHKAADATLGALILDVDAPMLGSMQICTDLWRMGKDVPTLIVTSEYAGLPAMEAGAVCHLFKPVDPSILLSLIENAKRTLQVME